MAVCHSTQCAAVHRHLSILLGACLVVRRSACRRHHGCRLERRTGAGIAAGTTCRPRSRTLARKTATAAATDNGGRTDATCSRSALSAACGARGTGARIPSWAPDRRRDQSRSGEAIGASAAPALRVDGPPDACHRRIVATTGSDLNFDCPAEGCQAHSPGPVPGASQPSRCSSRCSSNAATPFDQAPRGSRADAAAGTFDHVRAVGAL
jgi:hypothetical protein